MSREPEDVAPFAVYLCTDYASNINGYVFWVTGGAVALMNHPEAIKSITKRGRWTLDELDALFPQTLGMDLINPSPPQPAKA